MESNDLFNSLILREGNSEGVDVPFSSSDIKKTNITRFSFNANLKCETDYYLTLKAHSFIDKAENGIALTEKKFSTDPKPIKPIIVGTNHLICPNDSITISNYNNEFLYQWFLDDNMIVGQTGNLYQVLTDEDGDYSIHVRDPKTDCESASDANSVKLYKVVQPEISEKKEQGILSMLFVDNKAKSFTRYLWTYADGSGLPDGTENNRQFLLLPGNNSSPNLKRHDRQKKVLPHHQHLLIRAEF